MMRPRQPSSPPDSRLGLAVDVAAVAVLLVGCGWATYALIAGYDGATRIAIAMGFVLVGWLVARGLATRLPALAASWVGKPRGIHLQARATTAAVDQITTLFLDRWGTVTTGNLKVIGVDPVETDHDRNLRWFSGALEHSAHDPVARAIARLSAPGKVEHVRHHPGYGISGSVDRHPVRVGSPSWIGVEERHRLGLTVAVEVDHRLIGYLTIADQIRDHSAAAIAGLQHDHLDPVLVSEDTTHNTEHLAHTCGIEEWYCETAPEKRERLVIEHQERGQTVAFAGDPAWNSQAMAAADFTISDGDDADICLADLDVARIRSGISLARALAAVRRTCRLLAALLAPVAVIVAATGPSNVGIVLATLLPAVVVASTAFTIKWRFSGARGG